MTTELTKSFKENFDTLKRISESFKSQQELDIDALVPMVDEAINAYTQCKTRLIAVKNVLGEKLPEDLSP